MFDKIGNFAELVRNAGKIHETVQKATESLGRLEVEASSGGGVVSARVNGRLELLAVRIDPKLLADGDVELLEDLVTGAVNQALAKVREAAAQSLTSLAGGMGMPAGFPGMFGAGPGAGPNPAGGS